MAANKTQCFWPECCVRTAMKNTLQLNKPWEEVQEKLKEVQPALTNEDLHYNPQNPDELLERLSKKMRRSKEDIKGWIESIAFTKNIAS